MRKLAAAVKQKIADEIGFYDWYSKYTALDGPNDSDECKFACLAHGDSRPSASLNVRTGLWKCFAGNCGAQGDAIDLYRIVKGSKSASEAIYDLAVELGIISQISDEMVDEMHQTLINSPVLTNRVCGCLGVSEETLRRFLIGIHKSEVRGHSEARITIPIRGQSGFWEDIRRYHPHADRKVLHWAAGHGEARIFPIDVLRSNQGLVLCYSDDTEILTKRGWIPFSDLRVSDQVAEYWPETGKINFVVPLDRQCFLYSGEMVNLYADWCDLLVTPDHRVLMKRPGCHPRVVSASSITGAIVQLPVSGTLEKVSEDGPNPDQARFLVAYVADGRFEPRGNWVTFNLKKQRKKERLRALLKKLSICWKEREYLSTPGWTHFIIQKECLDWVWPLLDGKEWSLQAINWSFEARLAILREIQFWDGDSYSDIHARYFTASRQCADIVSAIAAITGWGSTIRTDDRPERPNYRTQYVVNLSNKQWRRIQQPSGKQSYEGNVYCCTVPSGFLVVRRKGKTVISGNCEGEKDCLRAQDVGITNAITVTGGSESFPPDYQDLFDGKTVYLCYDIDQAGVKGAIKAARKLATCTKAVYRIDLPAEGLPANGDFSDWCNLGNGLSEFLKLLEGAHQIDIEAEKRRWSNGRAQPGERNQPVDPGEALAVDYQDLNAQASAPDDLVFLAHSIGITAGMKPFVVPVSVEVTCGRNQPNLCSSCRIDKLPAESSPHLFQIDLQDESALRLIRCDDTKKRATLRALCGIPSRCPSARVLDRERGAFQQLLLSPPADLQTMRQEYGGFKFAYLSCASVPDNRDYWFRGRVQPDPKTQEIVLNLHKASPARSAIDCFEVNEETFDAIDFFKPTASDLPRHFGRLTDGISRHVGVYGRPEVALAVLESIYSAARFRFGGREIYPGVVETLIIGDPRTGKSKLATGLMRMINVGEYITCENVSAAGLIGGLEQIDDVRVPIWGAWPRNHNGFILLDEVDELSKHRMRLDLISLLSSVRSAGVAEITKILQARAPALVRSVWITNPADGKNISTFSGAVRAIPGVVLGRPDIARFTKAYAVAMESVTTDQIAGMTVEPLPSEVCRYYNTLAILTWSLQPDQITFSPDAERSLKREAKRLAEKYDAGIPLIDPGSCLDKIARLSIPVAILSGNFQEAGDRLQLMVDEQHAYYAVNSLEYYYDQDTMGYLRYSQLEKDMNRLKDVEQVEALLSSYQVNGSNNDPTSAHRTGVTPAAIAKFFLSQTNPTAQSFKDFLGNPSAAQYAWSILLRTNCLRQEGQNVTKTADFVHLLQRYLD